MGREDELMRAAQQGDIATLERLLSKSQTPLLRRGPSVNTQDSVGYTALHHAALHGHYEACQVLLNLGSNANARDSKGCCPLHLAAWSGHAKVAQLLVTGRTSQSRASINAQDMAGETALHMAAQHGNSETLTLLLKFGADALRTNEAGQSALDLAALYGRTQAVHILLEHSPKLLTLATEKHTPLHLAARNGHHEIVSLLLKHGMDVNATCSTGTALHEAALYGRTEVVRILIDAGIDNSIPNAHGKTATDVLDALPKSKTKHVRALLNRVAETEDESIPKARVVMDYVPSVYDEDALPLKQGDLVVILDNNTKGWWKGQVGTRVGVFPHTYVEMVSGTEADSGSATHSPKTQHRQHQHQHQHQHQEAAIDDETDDDADVAESVAIQRSETMPQSSRNQPTLIRTGTNPFLDETHADIDADIARAAANVFFSGPTAAAPQDLGAEEGGDDVDAVETVMGHGVGEQGDAQREESDAEAEEEVGDHDTTDEAERAEQEQEREQEDGKEVCERSGDEDMGERGFGEEEQQHEEAEAEEEEEEEEEHDDGDDGRANVDGAAAQEADDDESREETGRPQQDAGEGEDEEHETGSRRDDASDGATSTTANADSGEKSHHDSGDGGVEGQTAEAVGGVERQAATTESPVKEERQETQPETEPAIATEEDAETPGGHAPAEENGEATTGTQKAEQQHEEAGATKLIRQQQTPPAMEHARVPEPGDTSSFAAQYMGTKACSHATEGGVARALGKMRKSGKFLQDKPPIRLDVTWEGVSFVDAGTGMVIVSHSRDDLVCATVDPADACMFAYVTTTEMEGGKAKHYCHAFKLSSADDATTCAHTVRAVLPQADAA